MDGVAGWVHEKSMAAKSGFAEEHSWQGRGHWWWWWVSSGHGSDREEEKKKLFFMVCKLCLYYQKRIVNKDKRPTLMLEICHIFLAKKQPHTNFPFFKKKKKNKEFTWIRAS